MHALFWHKYSDLRGFWHISVFKQRKERERKTADKVCLGRGWANLINKFPTQDSDTEKLQRILAQQQETESVNSGCFLQLKEINIQYLSFCTDEVGAVKARNVFFFFFFICCIKVAIDNFSPWCFQVVSESVQLLQRPDYFSFSSEPYSYQQNRTRTD